MCPKGALPNSLKLKTGIVYMEKGDWKKGTDLFAE
jgi:hypothetical protein